MKRILVAIAALAGTTILAACSKEPPPPTEIYPVVVGEKTELYEVMGRNDLKLAPGVKVQVAPGPGGADSAFVLLRPNGTTGGYMACGCGPGLSGSCKTVNDNPEHASCSGGCPNSEGLPVGCELNGPLIGPPKDPLAIKFAKRPTR
jgi:hypothetical protein